MNIWIITILFVLSAVALFVCRGLKIYHYAKVALAVICMLSGSISLLFDRFAESIYDFEEHTSIGTYELDPIIVDGKQCYMERIKRNLKFSYIEEIDDNEYVVTPMEVRYDPDAIMYGKDTHTVTIERVNRTYHKEWLFFKSPAVDEKKVEYSFVIEDNREIYDHK